MPGSEVRPARALRRILQPGLLLVALVLALAIALADEGAWAAKIYFGEWYSDTITG